MESNTNNSITLTQKRIASAKGLHIICAIVAMLLNIMAFAVLAVNITFSEIMFLAFPIALAVLDVIFFVKALFSNYRFRYAINGAIVHSVIVLLVSVAAFVVMGMLETQRGIVFVTISLYAMLLVHVVQSIAVLTTALLATKGGKSMRKILSILFAAIFIAGAVIYGRMLLVEGFFGQGGYTDYRTVVYKLNDDGTYTAIDVLDGYGTETVVPHKFNGQHVAYIDCAIFSHEEITKVKIDCDHPTETCDVQVGFVNVDNLNFMNEKLSIDTPAEHLDKLRKTLYAISMDEGSNLEAVYTSNAIKLANSIVPSDLGENKVYVSFDYDIETLKLVGMENIIPVWVREKGTTLDFAELKSHATGVSYIDNSNVDNAEHLVWCHQNLSEKIFKSIVDSEGNEINGAINANVDNAKITFENLYHITFIDDTDETRWSLPGNYRYLYDITGEQNFDCLITTESKIQSKIDAVVSHTNEHRKGFKLAFKTGSETSKHDLTDLAKEIEVINAAGHRELNIFLDWTLENPTIGALTADGNAEGVTVMYGGNVALDSEASHVNDKIGLKYEWIYNGNVVKEGSDYTLENVYPNIAAFNNTFTKAGTYTLRVTAGNDANTSLTAAVEKTIEVGFKKKPINFEWVYPMVGTDNIIYSATDKTPIILGTDEAQGTTYLIADVINNDVIDFGVFHNTETNGKNILESPIKNVAEYKLMLKLLGTTAELYEIEADDLYAEFTIEPKPLPVIWGATEFVYDGALHKPAASVEALGGDIVDITVLGEQKNYSKNSYTATASTTNTNYKLEGTEVDFVITQRVINVEEWYNTWIDKSFTYNSQVQHPTVKDSDIYNLVEGETLAGAIIYEGMGTNVDNYTVTVSLDENSNYRLEGNISCPYKIEKMPLTVTIGNKSMEYSNAAFPVSSYTFTTTALGANDTISEILSLNYEKGTSFLATTVNSEGYVIDSEAIPGAKFDNYDVTIVPGKLTISKKNLKITIDSKIKNYNAVPFSREEITYTVIGLAAGELDANVFTLTYEGTAIDAVNANSTAYTIVATLTEGAKYGNYTVDFQKNATLTIKKAPLKITAVGPEKTYDGKIFDESSFEFRTEGLISGEELGAPIYSGHKQLNAGSHTVNVTFLENSVTKNYEITYVSGKYTINKAPVVIYVEDTSKIYDNAVPLDGNFSFRAEGLVNGEQKEGFGAPKYAGVATTSKNVGRYNLTIESFPQSTFRDNYQITFIPGTFEITRKPVTITLNSGSKVYDGKTYTFSANDFTTTALAAGEEKTMFRTNFTGTATMAKNVGEYAVKLSISGADNYEITYANDGNATFSITKAPLTIIVNNSNRTYDARYTDTNAFSVRAEEPSQLIAGENVQMLATQFTYYGEYEGDRTDWINAGTYTVNVKIEDYNYTEKGRNYDITFKPGTYTIDRKSITLSAVAESKIYDGDTTSATSPYFSVTDNGGLVGGQTVEDLGLIEFYDEATSAKYWKEGGYTLRARFTENYEAANNYIFSDIENCQFMINKKALTIRVEATGKVYDSTPVEYYVSENGLVSGDMLESLGTISYNYNNVKNVGKYVLEASIPSLTAAGKSYNIEFVCDTFEITPAELTITVTADSKYYDGTPVEHNTDIFGLVGTEQIEDLGTLNYNGVLNPKNAGKYTITPKIDGLTEIGRNYTIKPISAEFEIYKVELTITVTADSKDYDGIPVEHYTDIFGLVGGDEIEDLGTLKYDGILNPKDAGNYTITPKIDGLTEIGRNYTIIPVSAEFEIRKVDLTITVTADSKDYDGNVIEYNTTVDGLVPGDTQESIGIITYTGTTNAKNAGVYNITPKIDSLTTIGKNYNITFVGADFEIRKIDLTITVTADSKYYDGKVITYNTLVEGLVGEEKNKQELIGTITYTGTTNAKNAGSYNITPKIDNLTTIGQNYNITFAGVDFEIFKVDLSITITADSKVYDAYKIKYNTVTDGFVNNETLASFSGITYTGDTEAKNVGDYMIGMDIASSSINQNYNVSITEAYFNITPADLTITVTADDKDYNGSKNTFRTTPVGLKGSDTLSALGKLTYSEAYTAVNAGSYEISVIINEEDLTTVGKNYNIMYESDTFEIIPANLTITVKASSKTYDGKVITYSVTQTGLKGTDTLAKLGTLTYTGDTEAKNAGEYTIGAIIEDGDLTDIGRNYNITYVDANFTINKRTLNVTANATNKTYDGKTETSKFNATATGFVTGENLAMLGDLVFGGTAVDAVDIGTYRLEVEIVPATPEQQEAFDNYNIVYRADDTFVISVRRVTVVLAAETRVGDGETAGGEFSFTIKDVEGEEAERIISDLGEYEFTGAAVNAVAPGTYTLTITFKNPNPNYTVTITSGKLVITAPTQSETTGSTSTTTTPVVPNN